MQITQQATMTIHGQQTLGLAAKTLVTAGIGTTHQRAGWLNRPDPTDRATGEIHSGHLLLPHYVVAVGGTEQQLTHSMGTQQ